MNPRPEQTIVQKIGRKKVAVIGTRERSNAAPTRIMGRDRDRTGGPQESAADLLKKRSGRANKQWPVTARLQSSFLAIRRKLLRFRLVSKSCPL